MPSMKTVLILLIIIGITVDLAIASVLLFNLQPRLGGGASIEANIVMTIYAGEIDTPEGPRYGFGLSEDSITSPGPTLNFTQGDVVKFIVKNVGKIPHTFAVVPKVDPLNPKPLDNYDTGNVFPSEETSITVQFNQVGNINYQCTVPGHASLGMWGNITVSEASGQ